MKCLAPSAMASNPRNKKLWCLCADCYAQSVADLALSALIWPTFLSMALPEAQVAPQWV